MSDYEASDRLKIHVANNDASKPELSLGGVAELVRGFILRKVAPVQIELLELSHLKVAGGNDQPIAEFYAELSEPVQIEPAGWAGTYADLNITASA